MTPPTEDDCRRVRAELEVERAKRRGLESAVNHNPDLVARFDRQHRHLFVNPAVEHAGGRPADEFLGKTNEELGMPSELCRMWNASIDDVFRTGQERVIEFEFPDPDGPRSYQSRIVPEPGADGTVETVLGITREITALKKAERERERLLAKLELERSRLQTMFNKAPAMIALVRGPDHVYELSNPANNEVIGHRQVIGRPVREVLEELAARDLIDVLDRVYATGETFEGEETPFTLPGGPGEEPTELYLNFIFQPLFDPDGSVSGIFFHGVDVTELVRARHAAQVANRAKSEFLATISHELRTPLHAIMGYANLLLADIPEPLGAASRRPVERVLMSARHLTELIEEVLTFARLEAGREEVQVERVAVGELVDEVSAVVEPLAAAKGLAFQVQRPTDGATLDTDPRKLRQILLNLASNAIKFTDAGSIRFRAYAEAGELRFEIRDTGVGIAPGDRERIFEPFWQGERVSDDAGGAGLGLSVARRFARMLGGDIDVRGEAAEGTTFTVRLPLAATGPSRG